jgi:hypothetical protein
MESVPIRRAWVAGWRLHLALVCAYSALSVALSWPLPLHLSTHLTGDPSGDTGIYVWNLWHFRHEILLGRDPFYTSVLFAPAGRANLAFHNYTVFTNLLSLPLQPRLGLIATFNVLYLALAVMNAYAMFLLARHLSGSVAAATLAGVLFAFSPFLTARGTAHFSLVAAAPLPVFLLLLLKAEEEPRLRYGLGLGLTLAWALYCDPYYAVFCVLIAGAYLGTATIRASRERPASGHGALVRVCDGLGILLAALVAWIALTGGTTVSVGAMRIGLRSVNTPVLLIVLMLIARFGLGRSLRLRFGTPVAFRAWVWIGAVGVVAAGLGLMVYLQAAVTRVAERDFASPPIFWRSSPRGVDALAFFMPNPNSRLFGGPGHDWLSRERADGFEENAAALTVVAPLVIAVAFWPRRRLPRRWALLAVFFALLALGPFVWIGGVNTRIPTPWALLRYVPVIGFVRSPARFAVVVMILLSALFALAVAELRRRHSRPALITACIGVLLLFELSPMPRPLYSAEIPHVFQRIADDPRDVRVLELPTGLRDGTRSVGNYSAAAQFHQTLHGKRLVGGYLSRVPERFVRDSRRYPVLDALLTLSAGGTLTAHQRHRAFARRAHFVRRTRLGYVVIDTSRASPHLRDFTVRLLGLVEVDRDGPYVRYVPDPSQLGPSEDSPASEWTDDLVA